MIVNPMSFTYEHLSSLKFKELQKLSAQYHVNKRWAKKQELIDNLLSLKSTTDNNDEKGAKENEEEWKDGSVVFGELKANESNEKRLTFNITRQSDKENIDPRLTFEIPQNGKNLLSENEKTIDSRQTYDIPPNKLESDVDALVDSRATFDVAPKQALISEEVDPRATFDVPQNGKILLEEIQNAKKVNTEKSKRRSKVDNRSSDVMKETKKQADSTSQKNDEKIQVKMLTIPYARITRRNKTNGEAGKGNESPIKMSKKSINIKKSTRQPSSRLDLIKSPALSSIKKQFNKQSLIQSLTKPEPVRVTQSKIPTKLQFNEEKPKDNKNTDGDETNKENVKRILRRKSKTADQVLIKKPNVMKVSFMSPPVSLKNSKLSQPLRKTPMKREISSKSMPGKTDCHTPSLKAITNKPITATKMPDFNKIHQKQFQQMDSLHDYIKKKEERTRKLFGTPQAPTQPKVLSSSAIKGTPLFKFQSTALCKSDTKLGKPNEILRNAVTPVKKKAIHKETFKSKLPPTTLQTDIKDKNRSHIHGVRTNKRFELQMKFRNM